MATPPDAAGEIKRLYFAATKATIDADVDRAIALLISLDSDEARARVAVYMDGLAQMRAEWGVKATTATVAPRKSPAAGAARKR